MRTAQCTFVPSTFSLDWGGGGGGGLEKVINNARALHNALLFPALSHWIGVGGVGGGREDRVTGHRFTGG